jgi:hypothetical protein
MFKKVSMSIAVLALISNTEASKLTVSHKFLDETLDDDELAMTKQSISESE